MLVITAYILSILFLPFKEGIGNIADNALVDKGEKIVSSFTSLEADSDNPETLAEDPELKEFPLIPRRKDKEKDPVIWAKKKVAIDAESGRVLYEDGMLAKQPIASLTKLMTALVLAETISDWEEIVTISSHAASAGGAGVDFLSGEKFTTGDLFKAMVMNSDNTAARALAEHFGGSEEKFTELMNKKANDLGLKNTKFADVSGLDDENSYSCAYDIAVVAREALKYPIIWETMRIPSHIEIVSRDVSSTPHRVGNTNKLLGEYGKMVGGKTGFTYNSGYCLLMVGEEKERKVIGVVLDAGKLQRWAEMRKLLDWSFSSHKWSILP